MPKQNFKRDAASITPYVIGTVIYLVGVALLSYFDRADLFKLHPDGWGNWLAGLCSPLAFLWLIYAAVAQRAELVLQRDELARSNITQGQQQAQLTRQADALVAQAKLFEAQARAAYLPIWRLNTSEAHPDGVLIYVENLGQDVLDLRGGINVVRLYSIKTGERTQNLRGDVVPLVARGSLLQMSIQRSTELDQTFQLVATGLNLSRIEYQLRYVNAEQRIELVGFKVVDLID